MIGDNQMYTSIPFKNGTTARVFWKRECEIWQTGQRDCGTESGKWDDASASSQPI